VLSSSILATCDNLQKYQNLLNQTVCFKVFSLALVVFAALHTTSPTQSQKIAFAIYRLCPPPALQADNEKGEQNIPQFFN